MCCVPGTSICAWHVSVNKIEILGLMGLTFWSGKQTILVVSQLHGVLMMSVMDYWKIRGVVGEGSGVSSSSFK